MIKCDWWAIVLGLAFASSVSVANATSVQGRIVGQQYLRNPVWLAAKAADRHGYSFREPVATVPSSLRKLFPDVSREVCIVAFKRDGSSKPGPLRTVKVAGGRTSSVTVVVNPGTAIRFKNGDPFPHRLFGVGIKSFSSAPLAMGKSRKWTVKSPGSYEVADELAPSVRMWVVAKSGVAAVAYPSSSGKFSLNVPKAGNYILQAYFSGQPIGKPRPVKVGRRKVNLTRRPLVLATRAPTEK